MLLSTAQGLREFKNQFDTFVLSSEVSVSFEVETSGTPKPYLEFLNGLRVHKSDGHTQLLVTEDNWLELSASKKDLEKFESLLVIENNGDHNHFYSTPVSLIIEVDESWPEWEES